MGTVLPVTGLSEKRSKKQTFLVGGVGEGKEKSYHFIDLEVAVDAVVQLHPVESHLQTQV